MPKKEINDYIFYKIVCLDNSCDLCYVGSTVNWKSRCYMHKNNCNNENGIKYHIKVYKTIRANGGWDNFKMIQIGTREQLTIRQAEQIEEDYRAELKATMNGRRCFITPEQKLEEEKERNKKWRDANKDYTKEYNKEYRTNNIEYFKEYNKEYRTNNIDKIKELITCECGCEIKRCVLWKHKKTKKHIRLMELVQNN